MAQRTPDFEGTRCLVTGGLGFIGSNLVLALLDAGASVSVVDSLEPRHGGDVRNIEGADVELAIADIADANAVAGLLTDAEYVFNLAGQVSHLDSMENPVQDLDLNARSQLAFLELIRKSRAEVTVVYASTRQVYGNPSVTPVDESHPVRPVDVNGISKHAAESAHLLYHHVYGLPASVLRISNVYGPRQRLDGSHQGVLPVFVRRALDGEPLLVFGDGSQTRDCLYVGDAVGALLAAASSPRAPGQIFNIGHHETRSLIEIAQAVVEAAGGGEVSMVPWPQERERIAIDAYRTDYTKATEWLGWEPSWSLERGLEEMLAHFRARRFAWSA